MRLILKPRIKIHRKITWLLLFAIISLAVVSWLICISKRNIERTNSRIDQTYEVIGTIQNITLTVSESGSDVYRYLENGDRQAALRLQSSHQELLQGLDSLQRLTLTSNDQRSTIALLRKYILEKNAREDSLLLATPHPPAATTTLPATRPDPLRTQAGRSRGLSPATAASAQRRAFLADSTLKAFLNSMAFQEKNLLTRRMRLNQDANSRTARGLILGRTGGAAFMVIILVTLNADITRRKKIQEQLEKAMREAQEAKQMQEQFLANMSHEIRTPMNGIKGMTDLLLSTSLSGKQHEMTGIIKVPSIASRSLSMTSSIFPR